jgi:hypothetical protein
MMFNAEMKIHTFFIFYSEHNQVFTFKMLLHCSQIKIWNLKFLKLFFRLQKVFFLINYGFHCWLDSFSSQIACFRFFHFLDVLDLMFQQTWCCFQMRFFILVDWRPNKRKTTYATREATSGCRHAKLRRLIDRIKIVRNKWILLIKNNDYINH